MPGHLHWRNRLLPSVQHADAHRDSACLLSSRPRAESFDSVMLGFTNAIEGKKVETIMVPFTISPPSGLFSFVSLLSAIARSGQ